MSIRSNRSTSNAAGSLFEPLESRQMFDSIPGALDASFSGDGKANVTFPAGVTATATDVAVQADGKTVVVGYTVGSRKDFAVARFNFNGSIDTTFGSAGTPGVVFAHLGNSDLSSGANAVTIQPDGKILVAGLAFIDTTFTLLHSEFAVARFLPNGSLDTSFSGDGKTTVRVEDMSAANDIVVQQDGKIVIVGVDINGGDGDFAVARLNANGSLDHSFDGDGKRLIAFGAEDDARAVAIDYTGTQLSNPNYGKIVIAGTSRISGNDESQIAVARLTTSGSLDATFNTIAGSATPGGKVITYFGAHKFASGSGVVIQPDGKIVVAGTAGDAVQGPSNQFAMVRYKTNGKIDTSFGSNGTGLVETGFGGDDRGTDLLRTADGTLIVGGTTEGQFALAKYNANGLPDASFGFNGKVMTAGLLGQTRLAAGPGRRFVLAGGAGFSTARYLDAGANFVSAGPLDSDASEQGPNTASFTVSRSESLPIPTRVLFSISGTARGPQTGPGLDYTLSGMTTTYPFVTVPYVDIPAFQTSALVTLTPVDDLEREAAETAEFAVLPSETYERTAPFGAVISIADNDQIIFATAPVTRTVRTARSSTRALSDLFASNPIVPGS